MSTPPGRSRLSARTAVTVVVVAALAYGAGLVTGVVGSAPSAQPPSDGVLDEAAARIAANAASQIDRETLDEAAVNGMLGVLGDRWSTYYEAADFASFTQSLEGRYTGVGLWVRQSGGTISVSSVSPRSPAAAAGVLPGDQVLAVDGRSAAGSTVSTVAGLLRGAAGTTAVLDLQRGDDRRTVRIARVTLTTDDITIDRLSGGITVVRVTAFTRGVGKAVREAVIASDRTNSSGIVLDLRGNPGGLLTESVEVASAFLQGGPVVSYERRGLGTTELTAVGSGNAAVSLVVLVDGSTASAAEVVAGALQDRHRAVIVGSRTFGKGSVQEPSRLSDGSAIELTVGRYLTPAGRSIDGKGIEPDVLVDAEHASVAEARAIEVLTGLQASVSTSGRG